MYRMLSQHGLCEAFPNLNITLQYTYALWLAIVPVSDRSPNLSGSKANFAQLCLRVA